MPLVPLQGSLPTQPQTTPKSGLVPLPTSGGTGKLVPLDSPQADTNVQSIPDLLSIYKPMVNKYAAQYGIKPEELTALLDIENSGGRNLGSPNNGANAGMGQFDAPTARQYGVNRDDPESGIRGAAHYYADLKKKYGGDSIKAAQAYNFGPGHIDRGDQLPGETVAYGKNFAAKVKALDEQTSQVAPPQGKLSVTQPGYPNPHQDNHTTVAGQVQEQLNAAEKEANKAIYHPANSGWIALQQALQSFKDNPVKGTLDTLGALGRGGEQVAADATNDFAEHKSPSQIVADAAHYFTTPASMAKVLHAISDPKQTQILTDTIETHIADAMGMPHPDKWNPIFKTIDDIIIQAGLDPTSYIPIADMIKPIQAGMKLVSNSAVGAGIVHALEKAKGGDGVLSDAVKRIEDLGKTIPKFGQFLHDHVVNVRRDLDPHYAQVKGPDGKLYSPGKLVHMAAENQADIFRDHLKNESDIVLGSASQDKATRFDAAPSDAQTLRLKRVYLYGDERASKAAAKMLGPSNLPKGTPAQGFAKYGPRFEPKVEEAPKASDIPDRKQFVNDSVNQAMEDYDKAHPETAADVVKRKYATTGVSAREKYRQKAEQAAVQMHDRLVSEHANKLADAVPKKDPGLDISDYVTGYRDFPNPARKIENGLAVPGKPLDEVQLGKGGKGFLDEVPQSSEELTHAAEESQHSVLSRQFASEEEQIRNGFVAAAMTKIFKESPELFSQSFHDRLLNTAVEERLAHIKDPATKLAMMQEIENTPGLMDKIVDESINDYFRNHVPYRAPKMQVGGKSGQVLKGLQKVSDLWKGSLEGTGLLAHAIRNVGTVAYMVGSSPMVAAKGFMHGLKGLSEEQVARMKGNGSYTSFWRETPALLQNMGTRVGLGATIGGIGGATANDPHSDMTKRMEDIAGGAAFGGFLGAALPKMGELMDRFENGTRYAHLEGLDRQLGKATTTAQEWERGAKVAQDLGGYQHSTDLVNFLKGIGGTYVAYRLGTVPKAYFSALWNKTGRITNALRAEQDASGLLPGNKGQKDKPVRLHALGPLDEGADMMGDAAGMVRGELPSTITSPSTIGPVPGSILSSAEDAYYLKTHAKPLSEVGKDAAYGGLNFVPGGSAAQALSPELSPYKDSSGLPFWAQELMHLTNVYTTKESKYTKRLQQRNFGKEKNQ